MDTKLEVVVVPVSDGTAHGIWGGRTEEERRAVRGILRLRRPGE